MQPALHRFVSPSLMPGKIVNKADPIEQSEFVAAVQAEHRISSVTAADDDPVEFHNWSTEFPIYGTKYEVGDVQEHAERRSRWRLKLRGT